MSSPARTLVLVSLALVALAACGSSTVSTGPERPTPAPTATPRAAQLILRVTSEGGFIAPAATLNALPVVSVYDDGRVLVPGPVAEIYPGPLVPTVTVRDLGVAGAGAIISAIRAAGLDREAAPAGIPGDTGVTVFAVTLDGTTVTTRYALGGGPGGPGGPGVPGGPGDPASAAAFDLMGRLSDPAETWGQAAPTETAYLPDGYRIFVAPGAPTVDPSANQAPVAWPLSTTLDEFGSPSVPDRGIPGLRQGAALGADALALKPIVDAATIATPFTSGGQSYTLYVRPLLPDELAGTQ